MYQQASRRACYSPAGKNFPPCLHREQDPAHAWVASPNALMHHLWKCMEMIRHHYCLRPWVAFSMPTSALPAALRWTQSTRSSWCVGGLQLKTCRCFGGVELPCFNDIELSWIIYGRHHPQKTSLRWISNHMEFSQFTQSFNLVTLEFHIVTRTWQDVWRNNGKFGAVGFQVPLDQSHQNILYASLDLTTIRFAMSTTWDVLAILGQP